MRWIERFFEKEPWYRKKVKHESVLKMSDELDNEIKEMANRYHRTSGEVKEKIFKAGICVLQELAEGGVVIFRDKDGREITLTDIFGDGEPSEA